MLNDVLINLDLLVFFDINFFKCFGKVYWVFGFGDGYVDNKNVQE